MFNNIITLIICHMIGDYVLQSDFIATTKGKNWYHLIVHCFLYVVPFIVCFELTWKILFLFISHIIIDTLKARYNKISYTQDQVLHYCVMFVLYY